MSYCIGERLTIEFDTNRTDGKQAEGVVKAVDSEKLVLETDGDADPDFVYYGSGRVDMFNESTSQFAENFGCNAEVL